MNKNIYVEVSQVDDNGRVYKIYPCNSRKEAESVFKAVVKKYKEVAAEDMENFKDLTFDEEEDGAFYVYHGTYFSNFRVLIIEEEKKTINGFIAELEQDCFFV